MKILYENSMPFGEHYFSSLGTAVGYDASALSPSDLFATDVLAVRSTTKVNKALLAQAEGLTMVGTGTAGINHLAIDELERRHIHWCSAAGCNAVAVAEYVLSILLNAHVLNKVDLTQAKVGIIGAGHVGTALSHLLDALHISYVLNDPPLAQSSDGREFASLQTALACDLVTLHVPYIRTGAYATEHLIGAKELAGLHSGQLLINACRGEVVDEDALLFRLGQPDAPDVVLDVFANEPNINQALLPLLWLATPHIAGHSIEGKIRGTQMVYDAICDHMKIPSKLNMDDVLPETTPLQWQGEVDENGYVRLSDIAELMFSIYDIKDDDRIFRQGMAESTGFATMRKQYRVRRECNAYTVVIPQSLPLTAQKQLQQLGFVLQLG
jgi:erythronate-4-phosphate dehydrogenase